MQGVLTDLCSFLEGRFVYALIGGLAVSVHGTPRFTTDIDILIEPKISSIKKELANYFPKASIRSEKPGFDDPLGEIIYLIMDNIKVELIAAKTRLHFSALERAQKIELLSTMIRVVSAEDLILLKLAAGGCKDLLDVGGILNLNEDKLDYSYLQDRINAYGFADLWQTAKRWAKD